MLLARLYRDDARFQRMQVRQRLLQQDRENNGADEGNPQQAEQERVISQHRKRIIVIAAIVIVINWSAVIIKIHFENPIQAELIQLKADKENVCRTDETFEEFRELMLNSVY